MNTYDFIFFDLDGTLTDSGPGIMNGFAYAIRKIEGRTADPAELRKFVGPPLKDSFERGLGYSPDVSEHAIAFYREYYNDMGGRLENSVYSGIEEMLSGLKTAGKKLIVATSKGIHGTEMVLEHFGLRKYFDFVAAANDTDRQHKTDVLRYAVSLCGANDVRKAVMVGDRENDITAARNLGMDSIGVLYGYGDRKELTDAGATFLAASAAEVESLILNPRG